MVHDTNIPTPNDIVGQLNTTVSWFIWKEEILRVPLSTLRRSQEAGRWGLTNTVAKWLALFIFRMEGQGMRKDTFIAECIKSGDYMKRRINPTCKENPKKLEYLHRYMESAYMTPRGTSETPKSYKMRLYTSHLTSIQAAAGHPEMRIEKLRPNIDWVQTWKKLNKAPVPKTTRGVWYRVIHEIIHKNERLHLINMVQTDTCRECASKDTLEHRLLVCGEGKLILKKP